MAPVAWRQHAESDGKVLVPGLLVAPSRRWNVRSILRMAGNDRAAAGRLCRGCQSRLQGATGTVQASSAGNSLVQAKFPAVDTGGSDWGPVVRSDLIPFGRGADRRRREHPLSFSAPITGNSHHTCPASLADPLEGSTVSWRTDNAPSPMRSAQVHIRRPTGPDTDPAEHCRARSGPTPCGVPFGDTRSP